jgi:hypothetical protein
MAYPGMPKLPGEEEENPFAPPPLDAMPEPALGRELQQTGSNTGGGSAPPQPAAPAMVSPQGFPIPAETHSTSNIGGHTTETVATPEAADAYKNLGTAQAAEIAAKEKEENSLAPVRDLTAINAQQQQLAMQRAALQRQLAASEFSSQMAKLNEAEDKKRKVAEANSKVTSYWEDRSVPAKVAAALFIGLNQYANSGRGMGGGNTAWEIFKHAESVDRQTKLDKYTRSKEFLEIAQNDKVKARGLYEAKVKDIDSLQIAAANALEKELGTLVAKSKIISAGPAFEQWKAQKQAGNAEKNESIQRHLATQVHSGQTNTTDTYNTGNVAGAAATAEARAARSLAGAVVGPAATPKEGEDLRVALAAAHEVRDIATKMMKFNEAHPRLMTGRDDALIRERDALSQALSGRLGRANATGVLSDKEFGRTSEVQTPRFWETDPKGFNSGLRAIVDMTGRGYNAKLKSQGLPTSAPAAAVPAVAAPQKPAPRPGAAPSKTLVQRGDTLRQFLKSDEAKKDPEKAKRAREALRKMGDMRGQ